MTTAKRITEHIAGMDLEIGQLVVTGADGKLYATHKVLTDPLGDDCVIYDTGGRDQRIVGIVGARL